jgi:multiple sugar transport system permease protein
MTGRMSVRYGRTRGAAIVALCALLGAPLLLMLLGALRRPGLPPPDGFDVWPEQPRWRNFDDAAAVVPLARQLGNSLVVVGVAVPVTVMLASLAGYAAVVAGRRARVVVVAASVAALLVPASALWVPRVVLLETLGLTDRTVVVAFPALMGTSPFLVLLFALAYARVPRELYEAAAVEGLSPWRTWRTVAVPLAKPAAFAVAMLAFVFHWSNVIEPTLLLADEETWPLSLGVRSLAALEPTLYPLFLAGALIATVPAVLAFLLAQRALFRGTVGA